MRIHRTRSLSYCRLPSTSPHRHLLNSAAKVWRRSAEGARRFSTNHFLSNFLGNSRPPKSTCRHFQACVKVSGRSADAFRRYDRKKETTTKYKPTWKCRFGWPNNLTAYYNSETWISMKYRCLSVSSVQCIRYRFLSCDVQGLQGQKYFLIRWQRCCSVRHPFRSFRAPKKRIFDHTTQ